VSGPSYSESYFYADYAGRLTRRTINADASYPYDYGYNDLGRLHTLTWPASTAGVRFQVKHVYTNGRLTQLREFTGGVDGASLWSLNLLDAAGRAASEAYGNGLWLQSGFDPLTGALTLRKSGTGGSDSNVQHLAYAWSPSGALWSRQDLRAGLTETFGYDEADRLAGAAGPGGSSLSISYDLIGNLTYRSDVGTYTYHASKKHAVTAAGSNTYAYDDNGNVTSRSGASIYWTSYDLPSLLSAYGGCCGYSATFSYTPDRRRWRQVSTYASGTETTIYVGEQLEKLTTPVRTHWKHRLPTPSGEVQVTRRSDGTTETLYLASDHLGSVDALLNAAGTVLSRPSFNAWGGRRASNWQGAPSPSEWQAIADTTRRGYTGHEQLDNVMLVHMNGRVYDPAIGRFLSADLFIDGADTVQGWNRYTYVHNQPLSRNDPSGYASVRGTGQRTQLRDGANEISAEQELAYGRGSLAWQRQWGNVYSDFGGMPPIWSFSGPGWLQNAVLPSGGEFRGSAGGRWVDAPVWYGESSNPDEAVIVSRPSEWLASKPPTSGSLGAGAGFTGFPSEVGRYPTHARLAQRASPSAPYQTSPIEVAEASSALITSVAPVMEWSARIERLPDAAKLFGKIGTYGNVAGIGISITQGEYLSAGVQTALAGAAFSAAVLGYPTIAIGIGVVGFGYGVVELATELQCRNEASTC
jgi:RHS repeat-associated protein